MDLALYAIGAIVLIGVLARIGSKPNNTSNDEILDEADQEVDELHQKWHCPGHHKEILDRHFKLQEGVQQAYKDRSESPSNMARFVALANEHINEFPSIRPVLIEWGMDYAPEKLENESAYLVRVSSFKQLADVLASDGQFDKAVEVCEQAIAFGLEDGTKSCFPGRISRINKSRVRSL